MSLADPVDEYYNAVNLPLIIKLFLRRWTYLYRLKCFSLRLQRRSPQHRYTPLFAFPVFEPIFSFYFHYTVEDGYKLQLVLAGVSGCLFMRLLFSLFQYPQRPQGHPLVRLAGRTVFDPHLVVSKKIIV